MVILVKEKALEQLELSQNLDCGEFSDWKLAFSNGRNLFLSLSANDILQLPAIPRT